MTQADAMVFVVDDDAPMRESLKNVDTLDGTHRAKILPSILAIQILNFLLYPTDLLRQLVDLSKIITIRLDLELLVVFL